MLTGDSPKCMFTYTAPTGCVMMVVVAEGCGPGGDW